ncbi:MAG: efflux RND transporter periplasmic adaptor subunit [Flavisolibacter sp.]
MQKYFLFYLTCIFLLLSCKHKEAAAEDEEVSPEEVQTPVTITTIETVPLVDYAELNATSSYLQTNAIKASTNGYIKTVNIHMAQKVGAGQVAFTLQTKEAHALGNTINKLDPSFNFSGLINIKSTVAGFVQELNHQPGDYVQDGEQLALLSDSKSFGFVLNVPYELRKYVAMGKSLDVEMPDGEHLNAVVSSILPTIDSVSQTESVLLRVNSKTQVPQNLIGKVRIVKTEKANTTSLPKKAVLTDEAQTNFWVMKMIDSVRAVKVTVIKGMETADRVEIIRPQFNSNDKILLTGNYGLPDTARVKIVKAEE